MGPAAAAPLPVDTRRTILWVVPVFQSVYAKPFQAFLGQALAAASTEHAKYRIHVWVPERQLLHSAMNQAVELALREEYDALIVSDDDCGPPTDAISQLLRRYEAGHPIVSAVGFMRGYPHTTTIGRYFKEGVTLQTDAVTKTVTLAGYHWVENLDAEADTDGLIPADFCGFPIALISREALLKIPAPWFGTEIDGGACTHDVYFGLKASKAKVPIVVDRRISCAHLLDAAWLTEANRAVARRIGTAWDEAKRQAVVIEARQQRDLEPAPV